MVVSESLNTLKTSHNQVTNSCSSTTSNSQTGKSSGVCSVTDMKGLLQITGVEVHAGTDSAKVLALCDSASSHSWILEHLETKPSLKELPTS